MQPNNIYLKKNSFRKKRDYHKKILRNPFFLKDNKKATIWVNFILSFLIFFGIYYFIQHTSFWQIKNIYITGGNSITQSLALEIAQEQQLKKRFYIFTQDKIIFFNTTDYINNLQKQILLEKIAVDKNFKNKTINIAMIERSSNFYLINQGQYFTLDYQGNLISIIEAIPTSTLPVLEFWPFNLSIGSKLADIEYLNKLNYIFNEWPKLNSKISIKSFEIAENYQDKIIINTKDNIKIYLSNSIDIKEQLESLNNLFLRLEKEKITVKEYINMSIKGWIYYK